MRRLLCVFVAAVMLLVPLTVLAGSPRPDAPPAPSVNVGGVAPDFTLKTYRGDTITLSKLRGKVVLINFWATWCPPCRAEMPSMETLYQTLKDKGLVMLAVNVEEDAQEVLKDFLAKNPHSFTIPLDTQMRVQEMYNVYRFPETFIVDKNGVIVDHIIGARDWASPETIDYLTKLLGS